MAATSDDIGRWFDRGVNEGATHMIVVCDTYDYEDYPVYAKGDADAIRKHDNYQLKSMQDVMEVYDLRMSKEDQLSAFRVYNLPK